MNRSAAATWANALIFRAVWRGVPAFVIDVVRLPAEQVRTRLGELQAVQLGTAEPNKEFSRYKFREVGAEGIRRFKGVRVVRHRKIRSIKTGVSG